MQNQRFNPRVQQKTKFYGREKYKYLRPTPRIISPAHRIHNPQRSLSFVPEVTHCKMLAKKSSSRVSGTSNSTIAVQISQQYATVLIEQKRTCKPCCLSLSFLVSLFSTSRYRLTQLYILSKKTADAARKKCHQAEPWQLLSLNQ